MLSARVWAALYSAAESIFPCTLLPDGGVSFHPSSRVKQIKGGSPSAMALQLPDISPRLFSHTCSYSTLWDTALASGITCLCRCLSFCTQGSVVTISEAHVLFLTSGLPESSFTKACHWFGLDKGCLVQNPAQEVFLKLQIGPGDLTVDMGSGGQVC